MSLIDNKNDVVVARRQIPLLFDSLGEVLLFHTGRKNKNATQCRDKTWT